MTAIVSVKNAVKEYTLGKVVVPALRSYLDRRFPWRLEGTAVTDAALERLTSLPGIHDLSLEGTVISERGVKSLTKLPGIFKTHASAGIQRKWT